MKIARVGPPEFSLTFSKDQGWAIVAALRDYAATHPEAARRNDWRSWADALDRELRR